MATSAGAPERTLKVGAITNGSHPTRVDVDALIDIWKEGDRVCVVVRSGEKEEEEAEEECVSECLAVGVCV